MTKSLLEAQGITATGSLVCTATLHGRCLRRLTTTIVWAPKVAKLHNDFCMLSRKSQGAMGRPPSTYHASIANNLTGRGFGISNSAAMRYAQGLSFDADPSSEDSKVVEAGKARLRQALQVLKLASPPTTLQKVSVQSVSRDG